MTKAVRQRTIRHVVASRGGRVPSLRRMVQLLQSSGAGAVSCETVRRDYQALGLQHRSRYATQPSVAVCVSIPTDVYDQYYVVATRCGLTVPAMLRAVATRAAVAGLGVPGCPARGPDVPTR